MSSGLQDGDERSRKIDLDKIKKLVVKHDVSGAIVVLLVLIFIYFTNFILDETIKSDFFQYRGLVQLCVDNYNLTGGQRLLIDEVNRQLQTWLALSNYYNYIAVVGALLRQC